MTGTFRSLSGFNYRVWAGGGIVSNIGTWMQRTAQDWLVLTQLTHRNASAVGIVIALQFGPLILLLPWTGLAADHLDRRKLLVATQALLAAMSLLLGFLTLAGRVQLWHVYALALGLGCVTAFDTPARQSFISELVGESDLSNALALNSASFNAARMIGPAVAGLLVTTVDPGWVFIINALSFIAVLSSLGLLRPGQFYSRSKPVAARGRLTEGFLYVWQRPDLKAVLLMLFLIGTFGLNFPIFLATMSVTVFHTGAAAYGLSSSILAVGTVAGALLAASRARPSMTLLLVSAATFAMGCALAATVPNYALFALTLVILGVSAQTFLTSTNSFLQLSAEPNMRGRVIAIFLAVGVGGTPIGAPFVGWIADRFGPRWALGVGVASGVAAAIVALLYLAKHRHLRVRMAAGRLCFSMRNSEPVTPTTSTATT